MRGNEGRRKPCTRHQAWDRRPSPGKHSSRQGVRDAYTLARADGSQTGQGAPKGEEEEKSAQGTASRMVRLASAQVGRKRALGKRLIDPEKRVRKACSKSGANANSRSRCPLSNRPILTLSVCLRLPLPCPQGDEARREAGGHAPGMRPGPAG